ncbi:hypothetical protein SteCoe_26379 [Stentor coeruleus]|uniref:Protein kinase domain-containing protein n=1 Tax=Stentor coeruleus TaxID=5963 RepID=A0A1R2BDC5_9CILI|nr:hypothetical protein SteCoe_26379 [Stentor coeruleus]
MSKSVNNPLAPKPDLDFLSILGSGSFGTVIKAYDNNNYRREVAVKKSSKTGNEISRELQIMIKTNRSKYCVELIDAFYTVTEMNEVIQNLVLEYMPESLATVIKRLHHNKQRFSEIETAEIMFQILKGLEHIHELEIMHRDIKPENILINFETLQTKICDFGSAKSVKDGKNISYVVSRFYRAPELILGCSDYGTEIDIWAAGCILIELYIGLPAFMGSNDSNQLIQYLNLLGGIPFNCSIISSSPLPKDILRAITLIEGKNDILNFFKHSEKQKIVADLVSKMLNYNPKERFTASQCLNHEFFDDIRQKYKIECN